MGKILIAEDQLGVRTLLVEIFQDDEHVVKTAENGEEALRLFIDFEPELIVLDMKMPVMNGLEALRKIRLLDSQVAVIMMTAYVDIVTLATEKDLGILYYMSKPFDLFELRERVREIFLEIAS
ncbi:MAG TPA: response regulator [Desulfosporosinus sp.]|nr:response regulator [Desulfosporosinus sp.]